MCLSYFYPLCEAVCGGNDPVVATVWLAKTQVAEPKMANDTKYAPNGTGYNLTGPSGAPVVALAHGVGLDRHMWDLQVAALETDPSRVVL